MDLGGWLRSLGLERYEAAFRENEIDDTVLPNLTAEDLKDLGVSIVGHRRKLLDAIAVLHEAQNAQASAPAPAPQTDCGSYPHAQTRNVISFFPRVRSGFRRCNLVKLRGKIFETLINATASSGL